MWSVCTVSWYERGHHISWFLKLYILTTSKVISGWVATCDSAHLWRFYSAAPLGDQTTSIMTWHPTQSHYPDHESFPYSNIVEQLARKHQLWIVKSLLSRDHGSNWWVGILRNRKWTLNSCGPPVWWRAVRGWQLLSYTLTTSKVIIR